MATKNVNEFDEIVNFFINRHITLKKDWLRVLLAFIKSQRVELPSHTIEALATVVYDQWLRSDLQISTEAGFQRPAGRMYVKYCTFQVVSIHDISTSVYKQKKRSEDLGIQTPLTVDAYEEFKLPPKRMFLLELTDGQSNVRGVEHECMVSLNDTKPGCKVLICGRCQYVDNTLLLTPSNCQILGGSVPEQDVPNSA